MGFLNTLFGQNSDPSETIRRFGEAIQVQRDQLFGITLFAQGLEVMCADQPQVLEMNRQSFQNITERTKEAITAAECLLVQAKGDPASVKRLNRFKFPPIGGHPMLDGMTQRAQILVRTYERMFPDRPRSEPLSSQDMESLMTAAANQL